MLNADQTEPGKIQHLIYSVTTKNQTSIMTGNYVFQMFLFFRSAPLLLAEDQTNIVWPSTIGNIGSGL